MKISDISIKRPSLVIVVFTALSLLGLLSYFSLNYEMLPKFTPAVVSVSTIYPGASPNEVENTVTKKLEDAVSSLENVKKIDAVSFESLSLITITLNSGADVDLALNEAQRKINAILADLPDDVRTPSLAKFSLDDLPIITLAATSNMTEAEFYDLLDKRIQPLFSQIPGVAQVNLVGGQEREIQVNLDASKLEAYGLSPLDVQQVVLSSNLDFPTGSIKTQEQDILVRLSGKYQSVEELRNLVVKTTNDGSQIRMRDIADIQDTQKDVEKLSRFNRKSSVAIQVLKTSDANAVAISKSVREALPQIEAEYAANNLSLQVANDGSVYTLESANAVVFDLILAIILVAFIMLLFLHSFRNAVIVMIAIPVSLISTFIGMELLGFTLNLMSLLGLSLVVGILVDDAIVVIENIYRHMEMGKNKVRASVDGAKEIGFTVVSITFVIVVVFLPISLSTGMVSDILREFCVVVIIATLLSLLVSFTIVPLLTSRYGKLERITKERPSGRFILWFEKQLHRFTRWVTGILEWALDHKAITLIGVTLLLASSFGLVAGGYIGTEFFAQSDRGEFLVQLELPKDVSIEQTNQVAFKTEEYLASKPEITSLITMVGQSSEGSSGTLATPYKAEITVKLIDKSERESSDIYAARIRQELSQLLVGVKVKTVPVSILGTAQQAPIELVVTGSDLDSIMSYADKALDALASVPGATGTKLSVEGGNPEVEVEVDRDKMASLGLSLQVVGATMQTAFNGNTDGKFRQGEYEYDINIRFENYDRRNIDDVRNLYFTNKDGKLIQLSQFANVHEGSGPSRLERRDKSTSVKVQGQPVGRTTGSIVADFQTKLDNIPKPLGVNYIWSGDVESQSEGFGSLAIALLIAVVMVYFIMVALYDSFVYPFVVMFSIPLSIIGSLLALALTNNSLNIFTILGLIMLIGLVAKNAILLVDFTNQMKALGQTTRQALINANHARLRPILMTTIAMVFGMLPIALAAGAGSEWKNGLAWVIIGGLVSSLFLTLVIVPVVYQTFDSILHRLGLDKPGLPINEMIEEEYEHKEIKAEYE